MVQIHIRKLVQNETTGAVTFYFMLTATTLSLFTIPFGWVVPTAENLFFLVMSGIVGGVAQILITTSYRYAGAATLAPFDYIQMIYALLIGYFIFAEIPTVFMLAGAGIVICASAAITWRERQLGLMRGKTPPDPNNRA
jgi:drug/metabolite transporter (DMT)-like permease